MTRRALLLAAALACALLLLLALRPWSVALDFVEQRVIAAIEGRTGLIVTGLERAEIALLPVPRISLSQVRFAQRDGPLSGKAERLRAHARVVSLLTGQIAFGRIDLISPEIDIAAGGEGETLADWFSPPLATLQPLLSQSKIVIAGGSVFVRAQGAIRTILRDINLTIADRDAQEPVMVSGTMRWRGVPTEIGLVWPMAGEPARLTLSVTSPLMALRFDGLRSGGSEAVVNGRLGLEARSLTELLAWFGDKPRMAAAIEHIAITGDAQIKAREASLANASVTLDGERLDGAIKLADLGHRWGLSGTLAGSTLDLGRLGAGLGLPALTLPDPTPLAFEDWTAHDIDLRVSVDAARLHGLRLGDVATQLLVRKGRFEAGLLRATLSGGMAKGRLLALSAPGGVELRLQAALDRVNFGAALTDLGEPARLTGTGSLTLGLDGTGASLDELGAALTGKASLSLRQGEIASLPAPADLLRKPERLGLAALRDTRPGRTAYETATVQATIGHGIATLAESQMSGPGYRMAIGGRVLLAQRWLDLSATPTGSGGLAGLPVTIRGPLAAPVVELHAESGAISLPPSLLLR